MSVIPNIERIRELQKAFTQEQFCAECGISRPTLWRIYDGERVDIETLKAIAARFPKEVQDVQELILDEPASNHLCDRISREGLWPGLKAACQQIAVISGFAAMRTFTEDTRNLLGSEIAENIARSEHAALGNDVKNKPIPADFEALLDAIRSAHLLIKPLGERLVCGVQYWSEDIESVRTELVDMRDLISDSDRFLRYTDKTIRVILDPLDGSKNHERKLPFFGAAVAIIVEDEPRIGTFFDPVQNVVYTAALLGPHGKPEKQTTAYAWAINTGHTTDMVEASRHSKSPLSLKAEAIAIHMPRRNPVNRQEIFDRLPALAEAFDSIYALNAGIPAMVQVARQGLAAFANPWTNLHDIAAAEVICRATGCLVTDWDGKAIQYNKSMKTSVLAAWPGAHSCVQQMLRPKAAAAKPNSGM